MNKNNMRHKTTWRLYSFNTVGFIIIYLFIFFVLLVASIEFISLAERRGGWAGMGIALTRTRLVNSHS